MNLQTSKQPMTSQGCMGFEPSDGSCITRKRIRYACSCEMLTSNIYRLSYIKTATLNTSGATVYLLWPGKPDLRSDNYTFPEIRGGHAVIRVSVDSITRANFLFLEIFISRIIVQLCLLSSEHSCYPGAKNP